MGWLGPHWVAQPKHHIAGTQYLMGFPWLKMVDTGELWLMMVNNNIWLVGGFNHLEKYESQWEGLSDILWKIKTD